VSSLAGNVGGGSSEEEGKPIGGERGLWGLLQFVRKQSDWEREDGLIFLFFLGLTSFPKPCVNIDAKNYMAYIKERMEYLTGA